jgi:hypothetical protein
LHPAAIPLENRPLAAGSQDQGHLLIIAMPVTVKILTPLKLVVVDCSGVVTDNDWLDTFSRLWANPSFDRSSDKLIDTRRVERFEVKSATISGSGRRRAKSTRGSPKARPPSSLRCPKSTGSPGSIN